jgi:hypothetical protein
LDFAALDLTAWDRAGIYVGKPHIEVAAKTKGNQLRGLERER